jgi:exosortase
MTDQKDARMNLPSSRHRAVIGWAAAAVLLGVLAYPVVRWLVTQWLTNEYYSHGFLVPLVSGYFGWRALRRSAHATAPSNGALALLGAGMGLYLLGAWLAARYLSALALIPMIGGVVGYLRGPEALKRSAFPLAYLLFAVPLPFVDGLAVWLGTLTADWATVLVRLLGVSAVNEGGRVTLPSCSLVVGAPCSGVRSLVALLALAAVWAYVVRGNRPARAALLAAAAPLAALTNLLRITSLLWIAERWGVDAALTYYHNFSGPVFFALALAGLLGLSWGLKCRDLRSDF